MIIVKPLDLKKTLSPGEKQKICQLLGTEYTVFTNSISCEFIPIEKKYNIVSNDDDNNGDTNSDDDDSIPAFMRGGMPMGSQRVVIENGQQCAQQ